MKTLKAVFATLGGVLFSIGFGLTIKNSFFYSPKPYVVDLPEFAGRVFSDKDVHPGTFTVKREFNEISAWGKDGILTYPSNPSENFDLVLKAWRPDPTTSGVFQFALKQISHPTKGWIFFQFGKVEKKGDKLVIMPKKDGALISLSIIFTAIASLVLFAVSLSLFRKTIKFLPKKKK